MPGPASRYENGFGDHIDGLGHRLSRGRLSTSAI
jgi:hypothetical protein